MARPTAVSLDPDGNLYIADSENHRIRKVTAGIITTVAGTVDLGFAGDGGPARLATLRFPRGIAVDAFGTVYIADTGNNRVRQIGLDGQISTVMGIGQRGFGGDGGPAANAGHQWLGWMYEVGKAVEQSPVEAVTWYRRAATQGEYAQWRLGVAYKDGSGVTRDHVAALVWLGLAPSNGEEGAREEWETVRGRLTPDQLREANALAGRCTGSMYEDCP